MSEDNQPLPASTAVAPDTVVEMTDTLLAGTLSGLRAYKTLGRRPAWSVNGIDYFGVSIGEKARVIGQEGSAFLLQILEGPRTGREGWMSRDGFRVPPTDAASSVDQVSRLSLSVRLEIHVACQAAQN